jgi:hypothetical protein
VHVCALVCVNDFLRTYTYHEINVSVGTYLTLANKSLSQLSSAHVVGCTHLS